MEPFFEKRLELIENITRNILSKGEIKNRDEAESIARRWILL
jgi:hypothetical protein